ncbi:MAG: hypothetical protein KF752_09755 [Pirellulaceae bacterium]|nr:hypothetical protein [Pirellulaceae bacterium]
MTIVIHVDDEYRGDPERFPVLKSFLEKRGFVLISVANFNEAEHQYQLHGYPDVVIMDILDKSPSGITTSPGPSLTEKMEKKFAAGPQAPCIIYYTGISDTSHPAIKAIKEYNPYTPIVQKTALLHEDAEKIFKNFPERLQ